MEFFDLDADGGLNVEEMRAMILGPLPSQKKEKKNVPFIAYEPLRERYGQYPCDNRRALYATSV